MTWGVTNLFGGEQASNLYICYSKGFFLSSPEEGNKGVLRVDEGASSVKGCRRTGVGKRDVSSIKIYFSR